MYKRRRILPRRNYFTCPPTSPPMTKQTVREWELFLCELFNHAHCSPDLRSSLYFTLNSSFHRRVSHDDERKNTVTNWFKSLPAELFNDRMKKLLKRYKNVMITNWSTYSLYTVVYALPIPHRTLSLFSLFLSVSFAFEWLKILHRLSQSYAIF